MRAGRLGALAAALGISLSVLAALAEPTQREAPPKPAVKTAPARLAAKAPGRPDFSGTWALDTAASELGRFPGQPLARTDVIQQRGASLRQRLFMDRGVARDTTLYRYTLDSARVVNKVDGRDIEARAWWEGNLLRVESKAKLLMFEMWNRERWSLSADGKTLTVTRRVKTPVMEGDQRLVFRKR